MARGLFFFEKNKIDAVAEGDLVAYFQVPGKNDTSPSVKSLLTENQTKYAATSFGKQAFVKYMIAIKRLYGKNILHT